MINAPGSIRRLRAGERDKVKHHLLRLDGADRQLRFGGHASPARIAVYCAELDFTRALVLGYLVEGEVHAIGELKPLAGRWPRAAEIAISVEGPFQGRGVGSKLLRRLVVAARNRLFERLYMVCLIDNGRMMRLARRFDGRLNVDHGEVEARIEPPWPTWWTVLEETLDEASALVGVTSAERASAARLARRRRASPDISRKKVHRPRESEIVFVNQTLIRLECGVRCQQSVTLNSSSLKASGGGGWWRRSTAAR